MILSFSFHAVVNYIKQNYFTHLFLVQFLALSMVLLNYKNDKIPNWVSRNSISLGLPFIPYRIYPCLKKHTSKCSPLLIFFSCDSLAQLELESNIKKKASYMWSKLILSFLTLVNFYSEDNMPNSYFKNKYSVFVNFFWKITTLEMEK